MQGDTPTIVCTVMNDTEKFIVDKAEFDLCVCEGETAKHKAVTINASTNGNTVSVKMTKNETDEAGDIKLCIRFSNTKNNTVISTFPFILKATQNPSYSAVGQMDDVSALTDYVAEAKKYADNAKETTADVSTLAQKTTEKAQEAESSATAAKESANIADNRATEAQEAAAATSKSSSTATSAAEYAASCQKEIEQLASEVENNSNIAKSYAVGETSARDNEDIDNAKYYSEQAKKFAKEAEDIVGSNFITQAEKGVAGGVAVLNDNLAVAKAVADEDGNNIQNTYAKKTEIAEAIEVDSELSTTSTNPVQNKVVTAAINSASQQAGVANGILTQWQEQGRIPNGIANNLITTKEGYALDARQGEALDGKITELKKSVSDGKSAIASAITNEGVSTASDASFDTMVESIGKIFYKRLGTQLPKYYYANVHATSGSNGEQRIYRNAGTTTEGNWIGHEEFFGGALPNLRGCIIITWLRGINAYTIMRLKSSFLGEDEFETLYECSLRYYHPDGGTIILNSSAVTPGVEICTLCLACHS